MNNHFISILIYRPVAITMLFASLLCGGIFALSRLPIELAPSVEFPRLSISASWGHASPETLEMLITSPIEEIVNTINGVREVSSFSREGSTTIDVEFEQATDMNFARLELNEKLAAFAENLPPGVTPPTIQPYVPKDMRDLQGFLSYSLTGNRPVYELQEFTEMYLRPAILSIKGVANVQVYGGEVRELQIELDANKIVSLGLNINKVLNNLREIEFNAPVGSLVSGEKKTIVSARNNSITISELRRHVIARTAGGAQIRIENIGDIMIGKSESRSFYRINGKPSVTIIIDKEPGSNTLKVAENVFTKVAELSRMLPEGVKFYKESDKSEKIRVELGKLYKEAIISIICIWFVLVLFLRNLKAPLIILSSILFSIAGTFLFCWIMHIGLNLFTLAGLMLGFGRLVDDSIVVIENIYRHRCGSHSSKHESIVHAINEIALPVVASTITTIGALLPMSILPQEIKPYLFDFGVAVGISLLMSLLVSFTLIPSIAYRFDQSVIHFQPLDWIGNRAIICYKAILFFCIREKKIVILCTIFLFGLPVWLLPERVESGNMFAHFYNSVFDSKTYNNIRPFVNYLLGGTSHLFFKKVNMDEAWNIEKETYLIASVDFPQGTDIGHYNDIAIAIEKDVEQYCKGVCKLTTRVISDNAMIRIDIGDSAAATSLPYKIKERLTHFAAQTGGANISVSGFGPGYYSGGESIPSYNVKVLGYNYNKVKDIAEQLRQVIERNPRITEIDIDHSFGRWNKTYELIASIDRDAIDRNGSTVADVIRAIRMFTLGTIELNQINIAGEKIPYVVKFKGYREFSVDDLSNVVVTNPKGEQIRLADLIHFEERRTPSEILRENQQYVRHVSFEYKGPRRYGDKFVETSISLMQMPSGYAIDRTPHEFIGISKKNQVSLLWIAFFGIVIVFMILASLYESFVKPFIVILSVPFSVIGLFLSYYIFDVSFGRGGYAAVIMLVGIVVTNSIVLVDYLSKNVECESNTINELVCASSHRIRPVFMTTLTTIGGLIPLLIMGERTSLWYSLSIGTIGGMVSSTLLTLIIVPIVFDILQKKRI